MGDPILAEDWAIRERLGESGSFEPENLKSVEEDLVGRLATLAEIRTHLEPAYRDYQDQLGELYMIHSGTR